MSSHSASQHTWPATTLLQRLPAEERTDLLTLGTARSFPSGATLIGLGDTSNDVVLLLNSAAKVVVHAPADGGDALLAVRVGGDLVGELAALDSGRRCASVLACGPLRARVIGQREFDSFLRRHSGAANEISRMIGERLRFSDRRRIDCLVRPAIARLAHVLVEIAETYGHQVDGRWETGVPLTQVELGSLAGMAKRTVEKNLARLQHDRLVELRYRQASVLDINALRQVAYLEP